MRRIQPHGAGIHFGATSMSTDPHRRHNLSIWEATHKQSALANAGERIEELQNDTYACGHAELLRSDGTILLDLRWRDAFYQLKVWPPCLGGEGSRCVSGGNL